MTKNKCGCIPLRDRDRNFLGYFKRPEEVLEGDYDKYILSDCPDEAHIETQVKMHHVVAIKERAEGNEAVGTMWFETKIYPGETPVWEIVQDMNKQGKCIPGKLIITVPEE